jgi:hypothetical protein
MQGAAFVHLKHRMASFIAPDADRMAAHPAGWHKHSSGFNIISTILEIPI